MKIIIIAIITAIIWIIVYKISTEEKTVSYHKARSKKKETTKIENEWLIEAIEISKTKKEPISIKYNNEALNAEIEKTAIQKEKWTLDLLMSLEWKQFEALCAAYLNINCNASLTRIGADGGVDFTISDTQGKITTIGQCKAWKQKISVNLVREMYGIMASEKIEHGIYFTTSSYTADAINFCNDKPIKLICGKELVRLINELNESQRNKLMSIATNGDYQTPTCPHCDIKMTKRRNKRDNSEFWGCKNYPRCKNTLQMRKTA